MTISPSSPRPHQLPIVAPAAPVVLAERNSSPSPLDLLLITSEVDFPDTIKLLTEEAARTGIHFDVIRIEELEGSTADQKLANLHRRIGEMADSKQLQDSSATCVTLHGATRVLASDMTDEEFLRDHPDLADFVSCIGREPVKKSGSEAGPTEDVVHVFSACEDSLGFPGALLIDSIRHARKVGEDFQHVYRGPMFIASCEARHLIDDLEGSDGEVLLLKGKKIGLTSDGNDCMLEVINMMAERRQQNLPPFTGRDYWMQLRNVSGEHIAYVGNTSNEIHKVLAFGHCEPVITLRHSEAAEQPARILHAKLAHGSPKALRSVFDRYKAGELGDLDANDCLLYLAADTYRTREELQEKIEILEAQGLHLPDNADGMAELLETAIEHRNVALLRILLTLDDNGARPQALLHSAKGCVLDQPDHAPKLQALCDADPVLRILVVDWLGESIDAAKAEGTAASFDVSAVPYFAELLFERSVVSLPPAVRLALSRHLRLATKDKHRSEILNTVIWGDAEAAWNLAKKGAMLTFPDRSELEKLNLMPPLVSLRKPPQ